MLVACGCIAALSVTVAIVAAIFDSYTVCAIGLPAMGGAALFAYRIAHTADARTDQLVLLRLRDEPGLGSDALAAELAVSPAAVRLSIHRLSRSVILLPAPDEPADGKP